MIFFGKILAWFLSVITLFLNWAGPVTVRGDVMRIDECIRYQKMISWGTSSAWWSQFTVDGKAADDTAKLLFDKEEGLGLNVYRYNIGAGEKDNPATRLATEHGKTESFYVYDETAGKYIYDFTRDAAAVKMMDKALAAGADSIIMFCNSPHFSMTKSGQASGGIEEGVSNLPEENYQAFVDYVLTIADHFVEEGYPVTYISPINEPQWGWGGGYVAQEGCHYTAEEAIKLLELFAVNMQKKNTPYGLMGVESGQLSKDFYDYIDLFAKSKILTDYCDTYCGHSYWMDNNIKGKIKAASHIKGLMPELDFEMSEWCELPLKYTVNDIESALYMATVVAEDLRYLNANSWSSWTACEIHPEPHKAEYSDRYIILSPDGTDYHIAKRYYAYKQFSHFIPTDSTRLEVVEGKKLENVISTAYKRPDGKTVLVVINNSDNTYDVKLTGYKTAEIYTTDEIRNCEKTYEGEYSGALIIGAKSINTIIFEK